MKHIDDQATPNYALVRALITLRFIRAAQLWRYN
jgi:hypothetical protein